MQIKAAEIADIIRRQIEGHETSIDMAEVGTVVTVGDGIARVYGLDDVMAGELLEFPHDVYGLALNLEEDDVGCVLMGEYHAVKEGDEVKRTSASSGAGGRRPGRPGRRPARAAPRRQGPDHRRPPSSPTSSASPPAWSRRQPVKEPMQTGIKAIDAMIPIGRGQRELIIGDRQTGKTAIILDAIINQKGNGIVCVYVAIGQKRSTVAQVVQILETAGAMDHTIVVVATASEPAPLQYLAPYAGCAMGEYFLYNGRPRGVLLRRPLQARRSLPRDLPAAAPAAGPRGLPRRRLLPALPAAGARRQAARRPSAAAA